MSPRKPNMLEAFQASAKADQAKRAEANAADANNAQERVGGGAQGAPVDGGLSTNSSDGSGAGGPFSPQPSDSSGSADSSRSASQEPALGASAGLGLGNSLLGTAPRRLSGSPPSLVMIGAAVVLAMLLMFFLGKRFGGAPDETQAASPTVPSSASPEIGTLAEGTTSPANGALERVPEQNNDQPKAAAEKPAKGKRQLTAADRAFLSRSNRWSVRAIQFDSGKRGKDLAWQTYKYLSAKGLPAVVPITQGNFEVICVGAEPKRNTEIERIRAELRVLPGPPPGNEPGAYGSAYFVNIEDQIDDEIRRP